MTQKMLPMFMVHEKGQMAVSNALLFNTAPVFTNVLSINCRLRLLGKKNSFYKNYVYIYSELIFDIHYKIYKIKDW